MDLSLILSGDYTGLENRIHKVDVSFDPLEGLNIQSHFLMLPFIQNKVSLDEFVQIIYDKIVPFCIPMDKREKARLDFLSSGGKAEHFITDLRDKAAGLFQKSKKQRKKSGEVGELILFILQEFFLTAPQVACKMFLKTNVEMPVHGSDGIHLLKKEDDLYVLWGESKLYQNPKSAVKSIVSSIVEFNKAGEDGKSPKSRDLEILTDFPNINDPKLESEILNFFNPYKEEYNNRKEAYSCFLGFDLKEYEEILKAKEEDQAELFKTKFEEKIKEICKAFSDEIKNAKIDSLEFYFFLLPFEAVKELRKKFFLKIGFSDFEKFETEEEVMEED